MKKLDEHGILTDEAIELAHREWWADSMEESKNIESLTLDAMQHGAKAERDALLELFEEWIDEADMEADMIHEQHYLKGKIAELRKG